MGRHQDAQLADEHGRPLKWEGGEIEYNAAGKATYILRRMVAGERVKRRLAASSEEEAKVELYAYLGNPEAYVAQEHGAAPGEALYLTAKLLEEYLAYCRRSSSELGKENSSKWMNEKKAHLEWWTERLVDGRGRQLDLRRVNRAEHILPVLEGVPGEEKGTWKVPPANGGRHKREALKALYGWLRKHKGVITAVEDPVADLPVGRGRVAQVEGGKVKHRSREEILAVIDKLGDSVYAHVLTVQAATGWHSTEMARFVAGGQIIQPVPRHLQEPGVVAILVCPRHKNRKAHPAKAGERALYAATVLLSERGHHRGTGETVGSFSISNYDKAVKQACCDSMIPPFTGAWMRHTVSTFALEQKGVSPADAGKFLGHADGLMVSTTYDPLATPPKVPTPMDDPAPVGPTKDEVLAKLLAKVERMEARLKKAKVKV